MGESSATGTCIFIVTRWTAQLENQVTKGDWAIAASGGLVFWVHQAVTGIDEKDDWIYFTALKDSSIERHLYRVHSDGSGMEKLTTTAGRHSIAMSPDTHYYFDTYSNIRTPPSLTLHASDGKLVATLAAPKADLLPDGMVYPELTTTRPSQPPAWTRLMFAPYLPAPSRNRVAARSASAETTTTLVRNDATNTQMVETPKTASSSSPRA